MSFPYTAIFAQKWMDTPNRIKSSSPKTIHLWSILCTWHQRMPSFSITLCYSKVAHLWPSAVSVSIWEFRETWKLFSCLWGPANFAVIWSANFLIYICRESNLLESIICLQLAKAKWRLCGEHATIVIASLCRTSWKACFSADGDLKQVPAKWSQQRWKDARALVNIESSFYKLVGGRKLGVLDPAFLRLIAHIVVGEYLYLSWEIDISHDVRCMHMSIWQHFLWSRFQQ